MFSIRSKRCNSQIMSTLALYHVEYYFIDSASYWASLAPELKVLTVLALAACLVVMVRRLEQSVGSPP